MAAVLRPFRTPIAEPLVAWLVATLAGVAVFVFVLRRGRGQAFVGQTMALADGDVSWGETRGAVVDGPPPVPVDEAFIPRWRRPSLQLARHGGALGAMVARPPLRFAGPRSAGAERRTVSYRLVRLSDAPDELRSSELGRLDRGDEVEVVEWRDGFARVHTPDGIEGWIPGATVLAAGRTTVDDITDATDATTS